jgi:hypothetical protein
MDEDPTMTRPDVWFRAYWFQIIVAGSLALKGWATTNEVFAVIPAAPLWPWALWCAAVVVLGSTVRPFSARLSALAGATLIAVATLRVTSYLLVIFAGDLDGRAGALAWYLVSLWMVTVAVGFAWTDLLTTAGGEEAVQQGRDESG